MTDAIESMTPAEMRAHAEHLRARVERLEGECDRLRALASGDLWQTADRLIEAREENTRLGALAMLAKEYVEAQRGVAVARERVATRGIGAVREACARSDAAFAALAAAVDVAPLAAPPPPDEVEKLRAEVARLTAERADLYGELYGAADAHEMWKDASAALDAAKAENTRLRAAVETLVNVLRATCNEVERLGEWLEELGHPWQDVTIDRLESGRKAVREHGPASIALASDKPASRSREGA